MNDKYEDLEQRINKLKRKDEVSESRASSGSEAFAIAVELVAGVIVGLITGLFFDNLFDSKPIFLIICIILSIIAAFRTIWNRYVKNA